MSKELCISIFIGIGFGTLILCILSQYIDTIDDSKECDIFCTLAIIIAVVVGGFVGRFTYNQLEEKKQQKPIVYSGKTVGGEELQNVENCNMENMTCTVDDVTYSMESIKVED